MAENRESTFGNCIIWGGNPIGKLRGTMVVREGKVAGIFEEGNASLESGEARDLGGMHIIPGLIDAHRHFSVMALMARNRDAGPWKSKQDALDAIEEACRNGSAREEWVFFSGMDHSKWRKPALPSLEEIDAVARGRKVFVSDTTLHRGFASTEAVGKAGLNREILRCPQDMELRRNGKPKGTLWEEAHGKVLFTMYRDMIRDYGEDRRQEMILDEANRCLKMGLTHVHDPGLPWDIQRLLKDVQGKTRLKLSWSVAAHENLYTPPAMEDESAALHSDHAPRSVKLFLDGAHRTAASMPVAAGLKAFVRAGLQCLSEGRPGPLQLLFEQKIVLKDGKLALPYLRFGDLNELVSRTSYFTDRGYRVVVHALGNIAALQAVSLINTVKPACGASVEHMLILSEREIDAFASTGAVASIQPGFIPDYAEAIERMGAIPYLKTFPLRSLIKRGVPVCISSDGPCGPGDPLHNIRRAHDRKRADGRTLDPDEGIGREEALAAGTIGGSLSMGMKNQGLCEGGPATFCILDGDPFAESSRVVETWIDGVRAY